MLYKKLSVALAEAANKNSSRHHNNTAHKSRQDHTGQMSTFKENNLPSWIVDQIWIFFLL